MFLACSHPFPEALAPSEEVVDEVSSVIGSLLNLDVPLGFEDTSHGFYHTPPPVGLPSTLPTTTALAKFGRKNFPVINSVLTPIIMASLENIDPIPVPAPLIGWNQFLAVHGQSVMIFTLFPLSFSKS